MTNKHYGYQSENLAKQYLIKQHYTIIESNYYSKYGEIDLICVYANTLIFVEVKSSRFDILYALK